MVEQYLQHYQLEEGLCNMVLVTIGSLTDSGKITSFYDSDTIKLFCKQRKNLNKEFI